MGTNCSEFRIPSGTIKFFMCDLGTIVPKNVFLLITRGRVFTKLTEQNGPLVLKWNQLFRVSNHERNKLVPYL